MRRAALAFYQLAHGVADFLPLRRQFLHASAGNMQFQSELHKTTQRLGFTRQRKKLVTTHPPTAKNRVRMTRLPGGRVIGIVINHLIVVVEKLAGMDVPFCPPAHTTDQLASPQYPASHLRMSLRNL